MEEEVKKCVSLLKEGKVILYPTDTVWGIGCDATCEEAIMRIYRIKQRNEKKSMIILLDSMQRLPMYVKKIPLIAWDLLAHVTRPTTFIYQSAYNLPEKYCQSDGLRGIERAIHVRGVQALATHQIPRRLQFHHHPRLNHGKDRRICRVFLPVHQRS